MSMEENLTALVDAFDASWNAHDEEAIMDWFTERAVVSMSPTPPGQPDTYQGKEGIIGWVRQTLSGFPVKSRNHGELGDTVTSLFCSAWPLFSRPPTPSKEPSPSSQSLATIKQQKKSLI
jgi:hypothetical protein